MIFLPIVERELRVAARKRSTAWLRVIAALVALVIGGAFLLMTQVGRMGLGPASVGKGLFLTLTWMGMAVAISAGLFLTSDCLSEEKREGTLGFLFLTDLRGYDVVLGKLLATSLRGAYALLAVVPVLAVALTVGGVTGAQFWKTMLALLNALFSSLTAGLLVSALSRDSQRALGGTLLLLLLWVMGGPAVDMALAAVDRRAFMPLLSLGSPGYLFVQAQAWGAGSFWLQLLVNQAIGWTLLGVSCWWLPRTWTETTPTGSTGRRPGRSRWKFGGTGRASRLRQRLIDVNAVLWLACRDRWQATTVWTLSTLILVGFAAACLQDGMVGWTIWSAGSGLFMLVLYLGIASQSGRLFVEGRRSGLLELLLATPLRSEQIVQGQWRALVRMFGLPLILILATQLLGSILAQEAMTRLARNAATGPRPAAVPSGGATNSGVVVTTSSAGTTTTLNLGAGVGPGNLALAAAQSAASTLVTIASLVAVAWFGMWMGLTSHSVNMATLKTILFVQIVPWFVISFLSMLIVPLLLFQNLIGGSSQLMNWYPLILGGISMVLSVAKDVAFTVWARRKLYSRFRERAPRVVIPLRTPLPTQRAVPARA